MEIGDKSSSFIFFWLTKIIEIKIFYGWMRSIEVKINTHAYMHSNFWPLIDDNFHLFYIFLLFLRARVFSLFYFYSLNDLIDWLYFYHYKIFSHQWNACGGLTEWLKIISLNAVEYLHIQSKFFFIIFHFTKSYLFHWIFQWNC